MPRIGLVVYNFMEKMQIVYKSIGELKPSEYNPRKMTEKEAHDLEESIKRFGFAEPIVVNSHPERNNVIVGGHQRFFIAQKLGIGELPCVLVNLPLDKERELNLRLNKNNGSWDYAVLANFDMPMLLDVGFTELDVKNMFGLDPQAGDWATAFDKDTLPKELQGLKQITFILTVDQITEMLEKLKTINPDRNTAVYTAVKNYDSSPHQ